jgi:hypothetical protein
MRKNAHEGEYASIGGVLGECHAIVEFRVGKLAFAMKSLYLFYRPVQADLPRSALTARFRH